MNDAREQIGGAVFWAFAKLGDQSGEDEHIASSQFPKGPIGTARDDVRDQIGIGHADILACNDGQSPKNAAASHRVQGSCRSLGEPCFSPPDRFLKQTCSHPWIVEQRIGLRSLKTR